MEFIIKCHASVDLPKIMDLQEISCRVVDFTINDSNLTGNIEISGIYMESDKNDQKEFLEIVPFDVVFNNDHEIIDITCQNFTCQIVVGKEIECNFDVIIEYCENEKNSEEKIEKSDVKKTDLIFINDEIEEDNILVENQINDVDTKDDLIKKEEISKEYDNILNNVLTERKDNFLDEKEVNVEINTNITNESVNLHKNNHDEYSSIRIFYPSSDREVEDLCKTEKLNIEVAYDDYKKSKRIVVK